MGPSLVEIFIWGWIRSRWVKLFDLSCWKENENWLNQKFMTIEKISWIRLRIIGKKYMQFSCDFLHFCTLNLTNPITKFSHAYYKYLIKALKVQIRVKNYPTPKKILISIKCFQRQYFNFVRTLWFKPRIENSWRKLFSSLS